MKNKTPKLLTENDLLSIVESTEAELQNADKRLTAISDKILDGIFDAGTFLNLVRAGTYTASTVRVKDKAAFVLIHTRNALGWLLIEGAVSVGGEPLRYLFEGSEMLAVHLNAPKLVFTTKLKGLYDFAKKSGWKCLGIIMGKTTK